MVLYYLLYLLIFLYVVAISMKSYHMLQQNLYNENNRYLKWVWKNKQLIYKNIDLYGIVFSCLILFTQNINLINFFLVILMSVYVVAFFRFQDSKKYDQDKKPLVVTKRVRRLMITTYLLHLIPVVISIFVNDFAPYCLLLLSVMSSLNFYVVFIAMIFNFPVERGIYHYYEHKAKLKLKSMPNLKTIGITGSYGKTSCKNILADILNIRYNALPTPKSLNTFNGLMITINNKLSKFDDIFIAEMGAYVVGEIRGLCELVNPKYGIITSIGTSHLATFGSQKNIQKAKMELIEFLPKDGVGVLNADDENQKSYKIKNNCKILWIGIDSEDVDVRASNIICSGKGTSFDVKFKDSNKVYRFETKLLGKHNVYNILSALALGREFGVSIKDLQLGVKKVRPVEHRLELKKIGNFYQIDDAYNSNPVGAKSALEVLDMMDGDRIVVTPGMVELGEQEEKLNKRFGEQIADVANKVILIGEKRTKPIYDGLIKAGFKKEDIYISNDVREAYTILNKLKGKKDMYALFENDLPDTYTEK
ncbi:MAG: UDP-N-acetylmuramoyl-tripeptide--D-alanyl-D-alanine ligase [Bacilli bacterium]|nr:UDP-N-acetylmuramoyl-tripeptide--D-alanyl-D-alanine ligase [Bacilli bacterium]